MPTVVIDVAALLGIGALGFILIQAFGHHFESRENNGGSITDADDVFFIRDIELASRLLHTEEF